jgi:hypothetical protein
VVFKRHAHFLEDEFSSNGDKIFEINVGATRQDRLTNEAIGKTL